MPNSKITDLTAGDPAQSGDELPINRGGLDRKLTAGSIATLGNTLLVDTVITIGTNGGTISQQSAGVPDQTVIATGTTSNAIIIVENADKAFNFAHAAAIDPTLFIHSRNQNTTQWLSLSHDGSNAHINGGTGSLVIDRALSLAESGDALTLQTGHFINSTNGLWWDGGIATLGIYRNRSTLTPDSAFFAVGSTSNSIHIAEFGDNSFDFNNGPWGTSVATDPTLIIHSHNQSVSEYLAFFNDGTSAQISTSQILLLTATGGLVVGGGISLQDFAAPILARTITAAGTTGAQTINKMAGTVNFAAGASTLVVTNSRVSTTSIIFATIRTDDATATIKNVVAASGSFTITLTAAATAETSVGFFVTN